MTRSRCGLYELSLRPWGLLLLVPWAFHCPWQVRCSRPSTIARRGCTGSPYASLNKRHRNEYCVPCRAMALYDSVIASLNVNLRILWRSGRFYSHRAAYIAEIWQAPPPLVRFYSIARTNGRAVTLRYWKRLQLSETNEISPYAS